MSLVHASYHYGQKTSQSSVFCFSIVLTFSVIFEYLKWRNSDANVSENNFS